MSWIIDARHEHKLAHCVADSLFVYSRQMYILVDTALPVFMVVRQFLLYRRRGGVDDTPDEFAFAAVGILTIIALQLDGLPHSPVRSVIGDASNRVGALLHPKRSRAGALLIPVRHR